MLFFGTMAHGVEINSFNKQKFGMERFAFMPAASEGFLFVLSEAEGEALAAGVRQNGK
jgi:hypothetical protein